MQAIFERDREHPVSSVELGSHPNGGDDVLVLKLDNDYPMNYSDFCAAVQKFAKGRNLAFLLEPEDGGYYIAYSVRVISDAEITADQFHFMVKRQNRL